MILQQLSYSDINPEQLDLFSCLFSLKNKSFATKIHIQVQIAYLWTEQRKEDWLVFFGRITRLLLFSKEMDPQLGPWQNQKQRSKELNFAFF